MSLRIDDVILPGNVKSFTVGTPTQATRLGDLHPYFLSLLVNPENAYHWITIYGTVEEIIEEDDPETGHIATESIDTLASKYVGVTPYPFRDPRGEVRVRYKVRPTYIITFGAVPKDE